MGAAPGSGWEEGEFEFKLVFEEDPQEAADAGERGRRGSVRSEWGGEWTQSRAPELRDTDAANLHAVGECVC